MAPQWLLVYVVFVGSRGGSTGGATVVSVAVTTLVFFFSHQITTSVQGSRMFIGLKLGYGIYLSNSSSNIIIGNDVNNNRDGIALYQHSNNNVITKNTVTNNYDDGILDLMVKFDRSAVITLFSGKAVPGNYVTEVAGTVAGVRFKGIDRIRVTSSP